MAKLTQVAIGSRKAVRYTILFIIFLTIGRILFVFGVGVYNKLFPAPPPAPTLKFGKLTKIPFPEGSPAPKINFTIETPNGELPTALGQAKVYFMPKSVSNLLALDLAKQKAKQLGFTNQEQAQSDTVYKFNSDNYPSNLLMNIITGNFSISYDLSADRSPIDTRPPVAEVAGAQFRSLLQGANILPPDLTGPLLHNYYKLNNGQLVNSIALSEADLTKVNLTRKAYDELPSVYAKPDQSNVWAIVAGSGDRVQQFIAVEYKYYKVDETQVSTYPIKTPDQALSELKAGNYYPAEIGTLKDGDNLKIRKVYLAYYDPSVESDFYQPVYVFEGDNNFVGYVPAVTSDYYGK